MHPELPDTATLEPVRFVDTVESEDRNQLPDGLLLTYDDYRALRRNIIEYRREIADLRATIVMYRHAIPGSIPGEDGDE